MQVGMLQAPHPNQLELWTAGMWRWIKQVTFLMWQMSVTLSSEAGYGQGRFHAFWDIRNPSWPFLLGKQAQLLVTRAGEEVEWVPGMPPLSALLEISAGTSERHYPDSKSQISKLFPPSETQKSAQSVTVAIYRAASVSIF